MMSVTKRINTIKQPRGGYIPPKTLHIKTYTDGKEVSEVPISLAAKQGLVVDYMTRFFLRDNAEEAFNISILGAMVLDMEYGGRLESRHAKELVSRIKGLDEDSIRAACELVRYDTALRAGVLAYQYTKEAKITESFIRNIQILVPRCLTFLEKIGPVVSDGFNFIGGYTETVSSGDGDYLTKDTLLDFKVSKNNITDKHTLQLAMYYLLGIHSIYPEFKDIKNLCLFNPYKNESYTISIDEISDEVLYAISKDVLGYHMASSLPSSWKTF